MSQVNQHSGEALRIKREEFDVSRQELTAELERVTLELSNAEEPSDSESVLSKIRKIIKDLNDKNSMS